MAEQIVVGVVLFAATGVLGWAVRALLLAPRHVREWATELDRAKRDYTIWNERATRQLTERLSEIDEHHNARGMYDSGNRLAARARATEQSREEVEDRFRVMSRKIDDAFRRLGRVDLIWLAIKYRKSDAYGDYGIWRAVWTALTKRPGSMENQILEPVLRRMKARG